MLQDRIRPTIASDALPSNSIWGRIAGDDSFVIVHDDFARFDATTLLTEGGIIIVESGSAAANLATTALGVVRMTTQAADNDAVNYVMGQNVAGIGKFYAGHRFAWEAYISPVQIAAADLFIGVAQEALGADGLIADADTLADVDFVGFSTLVATPTVLNAKYNTASGGGITTVKTAVQTMVAASWYKLGAYCDGERVTFYLNGTPITGCAIEHPILITATNFPDGEEMTLYAGIKSTASTAVSLDIDWARLAYEK